MGAVFLEGVGVIIRAGNGNRELRWGQATPPPTPGSGWLSAAGVPVTPTDAYGLPAVSNVIRSPAEVVASLPYLVYQRGESRTKADKSWQWRLLHDQPSEEVDTYQFFYDLTLSLEATQNAFVQKAKFDGRVMELYVIDPHRVSVRREKETGRKLFDVYISDGNVRKNLTTDDILHIRGFTPTAGGAAGVSLIQLHRDPLGAQIAMQKFEGDYFRNNAQPPFWFTGAANREHAQGLMDAHNAAHQGAGRQWKVGALWGNADVKSIPLSMQDAMFVDAKRLSIEDACRIWRWPSELLELSSDVAPANEDAWSARFLKFYLLPRLRRIERAFQADRDLFPHGGLGSGRGSGSKLFGEFLTAALERADFVTRVRGYKDARQGSWITANEIRELENMPAVDGGDTILITPTGSAPNPGANQMMPGTEPDGPDMPAPSHNGRGDPRGLAALLAEE